MTQGLPPAVLDLRAPLLGRDADLRRLDGIFARALSEGETRAVTIVGPAGMGKTRLVNEYLKTRKSSGPALRDFWGVPRSERLAYGLFERLLRARFGVADGLDRHAASTKIREELALVLEDRRVGDVSYFLGELMGLPFAESPLTRAVADDPSQARLMRRAILRSFVESDAERGPLCFVCEDVHAADEDSIELLRYLIENLKGPIVIACLARPEFLARHETWREIGGARHEVIELGAVTAHESTEIMAALLNKTHGGAAPRLIDAAVGMAGGTPGLLEHMVRIFFDAGVLRDNGSSWAVDLDRLANAKLPLTVADAVAARIAALSARDRRLLEQAAAMGSVFWLGGLVALGRLDQKAPDYWEVDAVTDVADVEKLLTDLVQRDYVLNLPDSAFSGGARAYRAADRPRGNASLPSLDRRLAGAERDPAQPRRVRRDARATLGAWQLVDARGIHLSGRRQHRASAICGQKGARLLPKGAGPPGRRRRAPTHRRASQSW